MSDWQAVLKKVLDEKEKEDEAIEVVAPETLVRPWGKKNRG